MCRVVRQRLCTCETGIRFHICLSESFSPDGSHATPKACRSMIAPTPLAGASSPDSFYSICRSLTRLDGLESDYTELYLGLRLRACPGLSRFTLGKGSISVCLGSSAAGGPASESGTSFTAHASAHDPKVTFFCCERAMGPRRVFISFESAGGKCCFLRGKAMCSGCDGRRRSKEQFPDLAGARALITAAIEQIWSFQLRRF